MQSRSSESLRYSHANPCTTEQLKLGGRDERRSRCMIAGRELPSGHEYDHHRWEHDRKLHRAPARFSNQSTLDLAAEIVQSISVGTTLQPPDNQSRRASTPATFRRRARLEILASSRTPQSSIYCQSHHSFLGVQRVPLRGPLVMLAYEERRNLACNRRTPSCFAFESTGYVLIVPCETQAGDHSIASVLASGNRSAFVLSLACAETLKAFRQFRVEKRGA